MPLPSSSLPPSSSLCRPLLPAAPTPKGLPLASQLSTRYMPGTEPSASSFTPPTNPTKPQFIIPHGVPNGDSSSLYFVPMPHMARGHPARSALSLGNLERVKLGQALGAGGGREKRGGERVPQARQPEPRSPPPSPGPTVPRDLGTGGSLWAAGPSPGGRGWPD